METSKNIEVALRVEFAVRGGSDAPEDTLQDLLSSAFVSADERRFRILRPCSMVSTDQPAAQVDPVACGIISVVAHDADAAQAAFSDLVSHAFISTDSWRIKLLSQALAEI